MAKTTVRGEQVTDATLTDADFTGQLTVGKGGTGVGTLTGIVKGAGTSAFTAVTAPSGALVGDTDAQTLTNKTITFPGVASATYAQGKLVYDTDNECLTFFNNDSNVSMNIGQETWLRVRNVTGSTIANGAAVYVNGTDTGMGSVALAKGDVWNTSVSLGLATEAIANNTAGWVCVSGEVRGLNTSAFTAGALVYVSAATAGTLTATAPIWPNYQQVVGRVTVSNATTGRIHVIQTQPIPGPLGPTTISAPGATPTVNWTIYNDITYTGLAVAITSMTTGLTAGTPTHGQKLMLGFKDNGTARAIAWGASYISSGVATLLATTVVGKMHLVGLRYDSTVAKWVCISVDATGY